MKHGALERKRMKATLLALILPKQEREEIERCHGINPSFASLALGLLEVVGGIAASMSYGGTQLGGHGGGIVGWTAWHLSPVTWLIMLVLGTGLLRVSNYFVNQEPIGEPVLWVLLRMYHLYEWIARSRRLQVRARRLGPERPDRAVVEAGSDLVILASREKEHWDDVVTVKVEERFYKIRAVEERPAGPWTNIAYLLEEQPEDEPIRFLVHTAAKPPRNTNR
jgi:hypothetical protein